MAEGTLMRHILCLAKWRTLEPGFADEPDNISEIGQNESRTNVADRAKMKQTVVI